MKNASDFVYIRLHCNKELYVSGYTPASLKRWAQRIERWRKGTEPGDARLIDPSHRARMRPRDVYAYFDNDAKVKAPRDALRLGRLLDISWKPPALTSPAPSAG